MCKTLLVFRIARIPMFSPLSNLTKYYLRRVTVQLLQAELKIIRLTS